MQAKPISHGCIWRSQAVGTSNPPVASLEIKFFRLPVENDQPQFPPGSRLRMFWGRSYSVIGSAQIRSRSVGAASARDERELFRRHESQVFFELESGLVKAEQPRRELGRLGPVSAGDVGILRQ